MESQNPAKARRGCLFYGCIAGTVCLLAILLALLLGLHMFRKALNQFTDSKPMPLPTLELSQAQIDEVLRRFDRFRDAVGAGRPTPPLELSGDDINALIAASPDFRAARGKLYVRIEDDHLTGLVSIPMDQLPMFKGRYLNGTGTFNVSLQKGFLQVNAREILVKGKPLPGVYMDRLRQENLAAGANENSRSSVALNRLESITVKDGKAVLVPKEEK